LKNCWHGLPGIEPTTSDLCSQSGAIQTPNWQIKNMILHKLSEAWNPVQHEEMLDPGWMIIHTNQTHEAF